LLGIVALALVTLGLGLLLHGGSIWSLGIAPAALVSFGALLFGLSPKRLRVLGWALVAANLLTLTILITTPAPRVT
jgi:hypothetical protein